MDDATFVYVYVYSVNVYVYSVYVCVYIVYVYVYISLCFNQGPNITCPRSSSPHPSVLFEKVNLTKHVFVFINSLASMTVPLKLGC